MPAIASLEDFKAAQRDFRSMFLAASLNTLQLTLHGNKLALCALRYARFCTPYASRLAPCGKEVRGDEISEAEREKNK